jgi:DMSO/TMAO reductase YedYZ molybdopterin-dependent catalytic subunit
MLGRENLRSAQAGALATAGLLVLLYVGNQARIVPFVPLDAVDIAIRLTPGSIATAAIDTLRQLAKLTLEISGIVAFLAAGTLAGAYYGNHQADLPLRHAWQRGAAYGLVPFVVMVIIEILRGFSGMSAGSSSLALLALSLTWGIALAELTVEMQPSVQPALARRSVSRRTFLQTAGVVVAAVGLAEIVREQRLNSTVRTAALPAPAPALESGFLPALGTWPEITSNAGFYRIDIDTLPPALVQDQWKLELSGFVQPATLNYAELTTQYQPQKFFATLECISNEVGGNLISTTEWTGVRLKDVLQKVGVPEGTTEIVFEGADGFTSSLTLEQAMDERTILAYMMNGEPLPREHGFPVRIYTPNLYGEKNPKWIVRISPANQTSLGYWQLRGWTDVATIKQTAIINTRELTAVDGVAPVGGIAFAGAHGISKVEVRVNGGPWQEATLKSPALSPLAWTIWRLDAPAKRGDILSVTARCTDGAGLLQTDQATPPHPDGASGYDKAVVSVR